MIQANELRLGNRIKIGSNEIIVSKETIYNVENFPHLYFPIPLSEDWLVKFGCLHTPISNRKENFWNKELDFSIDVEQPLRGSKLFYYLLHNQERRKHILYVHQLQNLYFALTGQELEVAQ